MSNDDRAMVRHGVRPACVAPPYNVFRRRTERDPNEMPDVSTKTQQRRTILSIKQHENIDEKISTMRRFCEIFLILLLYLRAACGYQDCEYTMRAMVVIEMPPNQCYRCGKKQTKAVQSLLITSRRECHGAAALASIKYSCANCHFLIPQFI